MYILFLAMLFLVPWVIGIVAIIKSFSRKTGSRADAAFELEKKLPQLKDDSKRSGLLLAVRWLKSEQVDDEFWPQTAQPEAPPVPEQHGYVATSPSISAEPVAVPHHGIKSIDNINILLYIGAFLVVVAAGIFIGFNYQLLSGVAKTIFLLLFTLAFYAAGLYLYLKTEKMKPAGLTFATIGIVLFPLCGLAFYKFVFNSDHGNVVWFSTSLLTLLFYYISIKYLKKVYLNYLTSFVCLSILESALSLFDVPLYYFFWGMTLFAMLARLLGRQQKTGPELAQPLNITAQIVQPISLLLVLCLSYEYGWMPVGVNLIFGSVYYLFASWLTEKESSSNINLTVSLLLLPAGLSALAYNKGVDSLYLSSMWVAIALLYAVLNSVMQQFWTIARRNIVFVISVLALLVAVLIGTESAITLCFTLLATILVSAYSYYYSKLTINLIAGSLALVVLPIVYLTEYMQPAADAVVIATVYAVLATIYAMLIYYWQNLKKVAVIINVIVFALLSVFAISAAYSSELPLFILFVDLLLAVLWLKISPIFSKFLADILALILLYAAAWQIVPLCGLADISYTWIATALGLCVYLLGRLSDLPEARGKIWRTLGILGPYSGFFYASSEYYHTDLELAGVLGVAGALSYYEANRLGRNFLKYLSAGVLVAAFELLFSYFEIEEQHIYTATWAVYFGVLAYIQHRAGKLSNRNFLAGVGMFLLTVPLFFQATGYDGQVYGVILGIESIILLLFGMNYRFKLAKWWGAICLIIIVTNQIKDALFALPKWVIIGVVGLLFLGGATYLLSKHNPDKGDGNGLQS